MVLDTRTLIVVAVLLTTVQGVALLLTWRVNRSIAALRHWAACDFLVALGFLLIALRGPRASTLELLASSAALGGAAVGLWVGIRSFFGRPFPLRSAAALLAAQAAAVFFFAEVLPDAAGRTVASSLFLGAVSVLSALDLLKAAQWTPAVPAGGLGYLLLAHAGFHATRAALTAYGGPLPVLLSRENLQAFAYLESPMVVLALGIGFVIMTTERLQGELRRAATYDALTGVFNRRAFLDMAEREFARTRRGGPSFALLLLDIDHFKRINDTFGHQAGDEMLRSFTRLAMGSLRQGDLFGRYGGEEFCALLPETGLDGALLVAERLRAGLSDLVIEYEGNLIATTVSIGVAKGGGAAESFDAIVADADMALYRAKAEGRDRVVAHREMMAQA